MYGREAVFPSEVPAQVPVVKISSRSVLLLDPLGNEGCYERKIMRNWRNFLKMKGKEESRVDWKMETLPHNKQMDSSSCGVLVLKFAEHYLMSGEVTRVLSTPEAIGLQRTEIACELLEHQSKLSHVLLYWNSTFSFV
ncbi:unnamed protein product [Oreochromis niloticus]|nr:unnamed protein product [Mustela putorius furo]